MFLKKKISANRKEIIYIYTAFPSPCIHNETVVSRMVGWFFLTLTSARMGSQRQPKRLQRTHKTWAMWWMWHLESLYQLVSWAKQDDTSNRTEKTAQSQEGFEVDGTFPNKLCLYIYT